MSISEQSRCETSANSTGQTLAEPKPILRAVNSASPSVTLDSRQPLDSHQSLRRAAVALLLTVNAGLLAWGAVVHSPTLNEPGHLVSGLSHWQLGRFDAYQVNPPLARMIAAIPVLFAGPQTDWRILEQGNRPRPEFPLGERFVAVNAERSAWLFTIARWACIPFVLLGGYLSYHWANRLYGGGAGFLALVLWCFCPNILGHGQLITPDVPAVALSLAACYSFWSWLKRPSWWRALGSGLLLGLAELTKTTLLVFLPLWFAIWLVYRWHQRRGAPSGGWRQELAMLVARTIVALFVLNLGYGFEGSFTPLGQFKFVSQSLGGKAGVPKYSVVGYNRFADSLWGRIPVPLPKHYLLGIDRQRRDFENYGYPSYLGGQFSPTGWWYYYLYALAIKVPLGTWLLLVLAAVGPWIARHAARRVAGNEFPAQQDRLSSADPSADWCDEFVLLSPAVVILFFVSSQTGFSEHLRYVLPIFPFVFIWIGRLAPLLGRRHRLLTGVTAAALLWSIGSSLAAYPHSLSYFNEIVGGPLGGPNHLLHSNIDWGQDLFFLKRWLEEHPEAKPLQLAYYGYCDPCYFGIDYTAPKPWDTADDDDSSQLAPGWYAISVNFVYGTPHLTYQGNGKKRFYPREALAAFQGLKPVARAGYSIYIYHLE